MVAWFKQEGGATVCLFYSRMTRSYWLLLLVVLGAVIVAATLSHVSATSATCRRTLRPCATSAELAQSLFHQMARWSTAATQDENPMIAVLHANYGVGYMMALQSIASDSELEHMLGVPNLRDLFREVERVQHAATIQMATTCPAVAPTSVLAQYGSEAANKNSF